MCRVKKKKKKLLPLANYKWRCWTVIPIWVTLQITAIINHLCRDLPLGKNVQLSSDQFYLSRKGPLEASKITHAIHGHINTSQIYKYDNAGMSLNTKGANVIRQLVDVPLFHKVIDSLPVCYTGKSRWKYSDVLLKYKYKYHTVKILSCIQNLSI